MPYLTCACCKKNITRTNNGTTCADCRKNYNYHFSCIKLNSKSTADILNGKIPQWSCLSCIKAKISSVPSQLSNSSLASDLAFNASENELNGINSIIGELQVEIEKILENQNSFIQSLVLSMIDLVNLSN